MRGPSRRARWLSHSTRSLAVPPSSAGGDRMDIHPMRRGGAKSFVDDLVLGRGVVLSRAATSLRSIETQPWTRRFVRRRRTHLRSRKRVQVDRPYGPSLSIERGWVGWWLLFQFWGLVFAAPFPFSSRLHSRRPAGGVAGARGKRKGRELLLFFLKSFFFGKGGNAVGKGRERIVVIVACCEFWQSPKMWKGRERILVIVVACREFWQSPKIWKGRDRIPVIACREFWQSPKMWKGRERNPVIGL